MVYTISDKLERFQDGVQEVMEAKFQRVKTHEEEEEQGDAEGGKKGEFAPSEKWRIWKNVLVIGFAFMVHFTAFWGASNLQSSVNVDESMGTFTLAAIYGSLIISNVFLPVVVIRWLGCKWTMALSLVAYMPFIMSQFYPHFWTMVPAGLAVGLGGGPLWCAKCTYLTVLSEAYAQVTDVAADVAVTRFFAVFFTFYQFSQVWGNLISSAVLSSAADSLAAAKLEASMLERLDAPPLQRYLNVTSTGGGRGDPEGMLAKCGANFCPFPPTSNPLLKPPAPSKLHLIAGIYLACMIAATLTVVLLVDPMSRYNKGRKGSASGISGFRLLIVTLKHLLNPYQLLIIPIIMFIGAEQAFLAADFTAAFVACGWGIGRIGYVMVCFGVCNALAALVTGAAVRRTGRTPLLCLALALHAALLLAMLAWTPDPRRPILFFLLAGLWGVADAVWLVQINSLSGILFEGNEEAAYSNFRLWESTGSVVTYACSPFLCTDVKLYLLLLLLLLGFSGYSSVAFLRHRRSRSPGTCTRQGKARGKFRMADTAGRSSGEIAE